MSGAQPRRSCTVCAFMVDLLGSQIDAQNTRTVSLPLSGRAVLGADLNCSESRWGAADPLLCCAQSGAAAARCTAGLYVRLGSKSARSAGDASSRSPRKRTQIRGIPLCREGPAANVFVAYRRLALRVILCSASRNAPFVVAFW
jgi:hypothetical protein